MTGVINGHQGISPRARSCLAGLVEMTGVINGHRGISPLRFAPVEMTKGLAGGAENN
jgi:hypothetical protein